jgi:sugar porter (SP) family MFS transporter
MEDSATTLPAPIQQTLTKVEDDLNIHPPKTLSGFVIGIVAAMSGVLFGFDASIAAACGDSVNSHFGLTNSPGLVGLWVGCVPLGALFGAMLGGKVSSILGRKKGLLLNGFLFIAGIVLAAAAPGFWVFVVARLLMGLAIGNSAVITPMYMAEVAPPESRGRILFMYQLSIVVGILVSFIIGVAVDSLISSDDLNWRVMIACGLVPAIIFLFGMLRMPNSPRWLIEKGQWGQAHRTLIRMVGQAKARVTFGEIHQAATKNEKVSVKLLFSKLFFPVILLGFFLQFFQQATGINADMYFGPEIFREGGFDQTASMWAQVAMGTVNLVATIVSLFLVDRLGRRKLMMVGVSGIILMLCVQSYLFHVYDSQKATPVEAANAAQTVTEPSSTKRHVLPNAGAAVIHKGHSDAPSQDQDASRSGATSVPQTVPAQNQTVTYLIFFSILLYIVFFAISAGPLCWCIISEIFPMHLRGIGMSIAVAANWLVDYFVSQLFPVMKQDLGMTVTTLIYAAFTTLGLALAAKFLPETKGVPLEEIEQNIYDGKPLREIGIPSKG